MKTVLTAKQQDEFLNRGFSRRTFGPQYREKKPLGATLQMPYQADGM